MELGQGAGELLGMRLRLGSVKSAAIGAGLALLMAGGCAPPDSSALPEDPTPPPPPPPPPSLAVEVTAGEQPTSDGGQLLDTMPILRRARLHLSLTDGAEPPNPLPDKTVSITGDNIVPEFDSIRTGADGKASLWLSATPASSPGVAVVRLAYEQGTTAEASLTLTDAEVKLGHLNADGRFIDGEIGIALPVLNPRGSTRLEVALVDFDGQLVQEAVGVQLHSPCAAATPPKAELPEAVTTAQGLAVFDYVDAGCGSQDVITASLETINSTVKATGLIKFTDKVIPAIEFTRMESDRIVLLGTGGPFGDEMAERPEETEVVFTLTTTDGAAVPGYPVTFGLTSDLAGLALVDQAGKPKEQDVSDENGIVSVFVRASPQPSSTRVRAGMDVEGVIFSALSDEIQVSSWVPDQDSMSLSADILNVGGLDVTGLEVMVTVRLADKFNNPALDRTTVNFTTEYGAIDAFCRTEAGVCSVTWVSQEPRESLHYAHLTPTVENTDCPGHRWRGPCPNPLDAWFQGGRSTIRAMVTGEESFIDGDGDGRFSGGEAFEDLGEAFIDHNEDGVFNPAVNPCVGAPNRRCASGMEEEFWDHDGNGGYGTGNKRYNGSLCPKDLSGLDCRREPVKIYRNLAIVLSSSSDQRLLIAHNNRQLGGSDAIEPGQYELHIADLHNNPPASGSELVIEAGECPVAPASILRENTNEPGAWTVSLRMAESDNEEVIDDIVQFTLNLPHGESLDIGRRGCSDTTLVAD